MDQSFERKINMKNWYESKLIWLGLTAILGVVADGISQGWDWRHTLAAVIAALIPVLRLITDTEIVTNKKIKGSGTIVALGFVAISNISCAGIDLPSSIDVSTMKNIVCSSLSESSCFDDMMTTVGINRETCQYDIDQLIDGKISLDLKMIPELKRTCRKDVQAVVDYVNALKSLTQKVQ